jgi:hypothetical protein
MKYKVTQSYLKTKEKLIAAFCQYNDAIIFITKKASQDEVDKKKSLYRIYDDFNLVQQFAQQVPIITDSEDAESYSNAQFSFRVERQPIRSVERTTIACFNDVDEANLFVSCKCSIDEENSDTYLIYKGKLLIATLNRNTLEHQIIRDKAREEGRKGATLSPLSKRPTPPGGPEDYWVENENDDE